MLNRRISFGRDPEGPADHLFQGDNLDVLAQTADEAINVVYMDPPFGTGSRRRGSTTALGVGKEYRDVANAIRNPDAPAAFIDWLRPRLEQSRRVLASTGSLFLHLDYRTVHYAKVELDRLFGCQRFVNEIIWCYSVGGKSRHMFGRKHDTILWYSRSTNYAFYPDAVRVPRKSGSHMRVVELANGQLVQEKTDRKTGKVYRYPVNAGKIPEDWWSDIETLNRSDKERTGWPDQKPARLLERLIAATTESGDRVADWFCGSGTTAAVAQRLDRRFTTCDNSAEAVACAAERLERAGHTLAAAKMPPTDLLIEAVARRLPAARQVAAEQ